jgi:hypothetical protein
MIEQKERKFPFDEWQKRECAGCGVMPPCEQVKFNFWDYQCGGLNIEKQGCPWREDP